jgi:hypothetical protein
MRASELLARTGCAAAILKEWVRVGVILPTDGGKGSGHHADYDDANLVAVAVALHLKRLFIPVVRYAASFALLHEGLRERSKIEWHGLYVGLTPNAVKFCLRSEGCDELMDGVVVSLERLATSLVPVSSHPQLNLMFGITSVSR